MKVFLVLIVFVIVGCANTDMKVVEYDDRCENFVREELSEQNLIAFERPLKRIAPQYPMVAARERLEGYVIMLFDITEEGETDNIQVLSAYPGDIFEHEAKEAFSQWMYKPIEKDGVPARSVCHKVQLDFKLR